MTKLKRIRESLGFNQVRLAAMTGLSVVTLYRMEHGLPVSRRTKGRVAMALKVPISELEAVDDTPLATGR